MAASKGNQFWKLRSKHGRDKIFSSPEELWDAACEYFQSVDDNPFEVQDNKGTKNVNTVKIKRPYSTGGLCIFLDIDDNTYYRYKDEHEDFRETTRKIEKVIRTQQWEGATVGIFKENIIARTLGLTDKKEQETTHKVEDPETWGKIFRKPT